LRWAFSLPGTRCSHFIEGTEFGLLVSKCRSDRNFKLLVRKTMDEQAQIKVGRLLWVGPLTVALSVVAVLLIRTLAVAILHPDARFLPLTIEPPVFDTAFWGACAVFAFFCMSRYSLEPIREYRSLAWKVLLVSFVPDIAVAMLHWLGGGWPEAFALMAMHIAVWAICVTMLPAFVAPNGRVTRFR
jgi:hypothetical protein